MVEYVSFVTNATLFDIIKCIRSVQAYNKFDIQSTPHAYTYICVRFCSILSALE